MKKIVLLSGVFVALFFHSQGYSKKCCDDECCVAQVNRPQEPKRPYPYYEEEVSYENKAAGITLAGTLTLPNIGDLAPVVIIIHGSAPIDRDGALFGHKFYLVLADHLTRSGIGVLRFDKRSVGKSTGIYETATTVDFASDVRAGIEYLKTRNDINHAQIGLVGHSEGGMIASMVATQTEDVAFIVMMGAPGLNGEKIWLEQGILLKRALGIPEDLIALDHTVRTMIVDIMKKEQSLEIAEKEIQDAIAQFFSELPEDKRKWAEINSIVTEDKLKHFTSKWFRFFLTYEPTTALKQIKIPVMGIYGDLDFVVPPSQNIPVIVDALIEGGNKKYTIYTYPNINHAFQVCETGSDNEYEKIEQTMAPHIMSQVAHWIKKILGMDD